MGGWNCKLKKPISLDIKATLDMGLNTADTLSNIVDDLSTNSSMADVIIHDLEVATGVVVDGVKEVGYFFSTELPGLSSESLEYLFYVLFCIW